MREAEAPLEKKIIVSKSDGKVILSGHLLIDTVMELTGHARHIFPGEMSSIDISALAQIDTAGAWFLVDQRTRAAQRGILLEIKGANSAQAQLLKTVEQNMPPEGQPPLLPPSIADRFEMLPTTITKMNI